jgi:hypothetical protein
MEDGVSTPSFFFGRFTRRVFCCKLLGRGLLKNLGDA